MLTAKKVSYGSLLPSFSDVLIFSLLISAFLLWTRRIYFHPLAKIPGPLEAKLTSAWQIYHSVRGDESTIIQALHQKYGKVVRVGPNTVDIADGAALGAIYAEKGGFLKTSDYQNFYVDGFPTIFSTSDPAYRATRAKVVAPLFSNAAIRKESDCLYECVKRFVQRLKQDKQTSQNHTVELQEHARLLGLDVLSSYLFRQRYPSIVEEGRGGSILPWLNAFVDANQFYYFPSRLFELCVSTLEKLRPGKELEAQSATAVHDYTTNLPYPSEGKGETYQGRLLSSDIPREQIAAECKDVIFAGLHSFGGVLATTLWYLVKDKAM